MRTWEMADKKEEKRNEEEKVGCAVHEMVNRRWGRCE